MISLKRYRGLACLLLVILASPAVHSEGDSPRGYRIEALPAEAVVGEVARIVLVVEGFSTAGIEVADPSLDEGLALETKTVRPHISASDDRKALRSVEIVLEFRILAAGLRRVGSIDIRGEEGRLRTAPFSFAAREPGLPQAGSPSWRWSAPSFVRRFEAFELKLAKEDGQRISPDTSASFPPPAGMSLEPSGLLSWTAIIFEGNEVELPHVAITSSGKTVGSAYPSAIRVRPLPEAAELSHAIGRFSLALEGPVPAPLEQGKPSVFRLVLAGRGNQPALRLPEPRASLEGQTLSAEAFSLRRVDSSRPAGGAYEGNLVLEIILTPPRSGHFLLTFDALPVLDPDGEVASLTVGPLQAIVASASAPAEGRDGSLRPGHFDTAATEAASRLGAAEPGLRALPSLISEARRAKDSAVRERFYAQALSLLATSRSAARRVSAAVLLEAGLRWESGERGRALSLLYGLLRRAPRSRGVREIASACAGELGSGPPQLDGLPPPGPFVAAAAILALLTLGFSFASGRSEGRGRATSTVPPRARRPLFIAAAACFAALSLATACLAFASVVQRRERYAIVWTDRLLLVPSDAADVVLPVVRGSAARLRGQSPEFVGVILADGVAGWVHREEIYYY
jgi:hypothetical protein